MLGNEGTVVSKINMIVSFMGLINWWGREINQVIHIMMKSKPVVSHVPCHFQGRVLRVTLPATAVPLQDIHA